MQELFCGRKNVHNKIAVVNDGKTNVDFIKAITRIVLSMIKRAHSFAYSGIVDAKELCSTGNHVNIEMLTLSPFFIHESINGIICISNLNN